MRNCDEIGVKNILRLNEPYYDKNLWLNGGFGHFDLEYPDGTNAPEEVIYKAKQLFDSYTGAFAVHCRAGLGRTGTIIGIWLMGNYGFTAKEAIFWMRCCRGGMVIGYQADFLLELDAMNMKTRKDFHLYSRYSNLSASTNHTDQTKYTTGNIDDRANMRLSNKFTKSSYGGSTFKGNDNFEVTPTKRHPKNNLLSSYDDNVSSSLNLKGASTGTIWLTKKPEHRLSSEVSSYYNQNNNNDNNDFADVAD